jgi:transposase-like protein
MAKGQRKVASDKSGIVAKLPRACMDETAAVEFFEEQRWGNEPRCAHCESREIYQMRDRATGERNKRYLWRCRSCGKQFTVRVGTIYEDSPIPLRCWVHAFWRACSSKKGVSALQIKREVGVTYKSALFMLHRIRFAMTPDFAAMPVMGKATGIVEADETYVGGKPRHKFEHGAGFRRGVFSKTGKAPVFAIVERGGDLRSFAPADVTAANVARILKENVSADSYLMTDKSPVYTAVGREFLRHIALNHTKGEYAHPGGIHSNTIESAFSLLKRGIMGTFHNVSRKHLHRYVAEFDFRWNSRKIDDGARTALAIKSAEGKRLRYREPIAEAK